MGWRRGHSSVQVDEDLASITAAQSCISLGRHASKWPSAGRSMGVLLAVVKCDAASVLCGLIYVTMPLLSAKIRVAKKRKLITLI